MTHEITSTITNSAMAQKVYNEGGEGYKFLSIYARELDQALFKLFGKTDWTLLEGLHVLDLGCGSIHTPTSRDFPYVPWFCRLTARNGAETYGIDLYRPHPIDASIYHHLQADLVRLVTTDHLKNTPGLPSTQFDIIHWSLFDTSPEFFDTIKSALTTVDQFRNRLVSQSREMLKENGLILAEGNTYRK